MSELESNKTYVTGSSGPSRRELLGSVATLGASALLPLGSGLAQRSETASSRKGKIDVHYHIGQRRNPNGKARANMGRFGDWTPELAIEDMDRAGVAVGMLSAAAGGGLPQPRKWNETAAQLAGDHAGCFGLLAALLMTDVDESLKEIEYSTKVLKADGFGILTSYGDAWLGDAKFYPIYEELNRRKAVIFVHPTDAPCCAPAAMTYVKPPMNGSWLEWPMHTARTVFSLMANGTLRQFPDIRFIFAHSGGVMPLLVDRLIGMGTAENFGPEVMKTIFPEGIESELRKCYFEIAQGFAPLNIYALKRMVPASHILFGSDYPFFMPSLAGKGLVDLKLPVDEQKAIEKGNAEMLFPRWKT